LILAPIRGCDFGIGKENIEAIGAAGSADGTNTAQVAQNGRSGWGEVIVRDVFFDLERADKVLRLRSSHDFYLEHMIENFDYYVDSVVPLRVDGKLMVDMSSPRYHRLNGYADIPFLFPSHTEPYKTTAEYLDFAHLSEGNIVLDIGAYSGVTSIIFAGGGGICSAHMSAGRRVCAIDRGEAQIVVLGCQR
jgi:hypothetical protein